MPGFPVCPRHLDYIIGDAIKDLDLRSEIAQQLGEREVSEQIQAVQARYEREREQRLDFFFQAEDGIRDGTVTGVQTCALPISSLSFLGFGDISMPSWGEIVSQGRLYVTSGLTYLVVWPGLTIFLTLTAFNLFGQEIGRASCRERV